jgi:hypothetical protein
LSALHVILVVVVVVVLGINTIFQHTIGYVWWPVIMVEEEPELKPRKEPPTQEKLLADFLTYRI